MINEIILLIITNDLTGQASEEEINTLKDWLSESSDNANQYHSYKEAFLNGKYEAKSKNNNEAYKKLSERLGFDKAKTISISEYESGSFKRNRLSNDWIRSVAAVILVLFTTTFVIYHTRDFWKPAKQIIPTDKLIVKSNPRGVKTLITLPDGSKVKLSSESSIEYYSSFKENRKVNLVGEAFFEVVRDTLNPFFVKAGDLNIRVLGTSFNVEAFPFEDQLKIALVTGKLMIEKREGLESRFLEYLEPSEMLVYNRNEFVFNKTTFNYLETLGWKDGKLTFKEADIKEVVEKLERWYGVEIIVAEGTEIVDGFNGIYKCLPLEVVLEGIGFTLDFSFRIEGNKVFIN